MTEQKQEKTTHPFWVMVQKEMSDQIRSWRFLILLAIIVLTCIGSIYGALNNIRQAVSDDSDFIFLKLFTTSDGTLPSFFTFVNFLGPLLGIGLGFDAINSERNKGTLSRIMSQPIHRDSVLNAKFTASIIVIAILFFSLSFLVMGMGLITLGIPQTPQEFWRVVFYTLVSIFYVAFWLNLSILFSVRFRQPATSALSGIAVWLFFSVFYGMILNLIARAIAPSGQTTVDEYIRFQELMLGLQRLSPSTLFGEATTTLLMPSVPTLGFLTQEQAYRYIPSPLPISQSLILVWPQLTGMVAATLICFAVSYVLFMRQEIRSR